MERDQHLRLLGDADLSLERFLNPTRKDDAEVRMYISQLEIMRFKARSEGREEDFKSCWYDYRVLMRRRGDGHLVPVRDVEVEYYREKIVWDLMWKDCAFPGIDPSQRRYCSVGTRFPRISRSRLGPHHIFHSSSSPGSTFWIDKQPTYNIKRETDNETEHQRHVFRPPPTYASDNKENHSIMDLSVPQPRHERELIMPKPSTEIKVSGSSPTVQIRSLKRGLEPPNRGNVKRRRLLEREPPVITMKEENF